MQDDQEFELQGEPLEEDFAPSPAKDPGPLGKRPSIALALPAIALYAVCCAVSMSYWQRYGANYLPIERSAIYTSAEYWRGFTALFTHSDLEHLLSNAPLFLIFGWLLHAHFGFFVFPVAALMVGFFTNLATVYFMKEGVRLVGASGMLYGMAAMWIIFYVRYDIRFSVFFRIFRAIGVSLILLFPTAFFPNVSYLSHALGFAIGLLTGLVLLPITRVIDPDTGNDLQKPQRMHH